MTQPLPEPRHFNPHGGLDPENSLNLLEGRHGIVAVVATPEAHASGWAAEAALGLAEASQQAGHPTGLIDLAVATPRLHGAAGVEAGEGLVDLVVFGASLDRVTRQLDSGVRVVTAGTPVGDESELWTATDSDVDSPEAAWAEAARTLAEDGCVLAYVVTDSPGVDQVLGSAQDVILVRHEGDGVAQLAVGPSLVLEPQPAATLDAEILPAPVVDADVPGTPDLADLDADVPDTPDLAELDRVAPDSTEIEAMTPAPMHVTAQTDTSEASDVEEVVLDLDDVIDDSPLDGETLLTADEVIPSSEVSDSIDAGVSGLEVDPEWPAFQEPLDVQEPGSLDPLVASVGEADTATPDSGLDDIVGGDSGMTIISEDLEGAADSIAGMDIGDSTADSGPLAGAVDGLIDGSQDTLNRAGELGLPAADQVTGLDDEVTPPLRDSKGWGPPPAASDEAPDMGLDDLAGGFADGGVGDETPTFAGPPSEGLAGDGPPVEKERMVDPWGEPMEEPEPAPEPVPTEASPLLETASLADEATPESEAPSSELPWDGRLDEKAGAVAKEAEVPVAEVTRTRTRNRSTGPRPFLLILFLLLVITVGVLWWVELLDVPILDGLRGGTP